MWWIVGCIPILIVLFWLLYIYFEESWDQKGTGQITQVIDGENIELKDNGQMIRIKLAFIDAPSPKSIHGQKAINHLKKQIQYFPEAHYRAKKIGDQYIGEITLKSFDWNLSLNRQLISNGLARANLNEKGKWKETTINSYAKSQELTKNMKRGIWAYEGYVTKDGFNPKIEKQIAQQVYQAKQQQQQKKHAQQKQTEQYYQTIKNRLTSIKHQQPKISYIHYRDNPEKRGTYSYTLWVKVYVTEEKWANMTQSQKLSLIVTTEKEIKDKLHPLSPFKQGGSVIVRFFSDVAKDEVARKKLLNLRGHGWRILR